MFVEGGDVEKNTAGIEVTKVMRKSTPVVQTRVSRSPPEVPSSPRTPGCSNSRSRIGRLWTARASDGMVNDAGQRVQPPQWLWLTAAWLWLTAASSWWRAALPQHSRPSGRTGHSRCRRMHGVVEKHRRVGEQTDCAVQSMIV